MTSRTDSLHRQLMALSGRRNAGVNEVPPLWLLLFFVPIFRFVLPSWRREDFQNADVALTTTTR